MGHMPIIDDNPGRGVKREFSSAEAVRYHERSAVERVNSHLQVPQGVKKNSEKKPCQKRGRMDNIQKLIKLMQIQTLSIKGASRSASMQAVVR